MRCPAYGSRKTLIRLLDRVGNSEMFLMQGDWTQRGSSATRLRTARRPFPAVEKVGLTR